MPYQCTIIIPVYNEYDNLKRLEQELLKFLKVSTLSTCVLFINDGSTDNSQDFIDKSCAKNEAFNYICLTENNGLSAALKIGFDHADTPLLGYMDADLQTSPQDFNLLFKHIHNFDLVNGVRTQRNDSFIKKLSSKGANSIRRLFTKDDMLDTGCPLKLIRTDFARRIPMFKGLHRFLPAMILLQNGSITQVPVQHFPRIAGTSKFGVRNRMLSALTDCFAYLWMKKRYINYSNLTVD